MDRRTLEQYIGLRKNQVERGIQNSGDKAALLHSSSVGDKDDIYAEDKTAFLRDRTSRLRVRQGQLLSVLFETPADGQVLSPPKEITEKNLTFFTRNITIPDLGNFILFSGMTTFEDGARDHNLYIRPPEDLIRAIARSQAMRDNLHLAGFAPRTNHRHRPFFARSQSSIFKGVGENAGPNTDIDATGSGFVNLALPSRTAHLEDSVETLEAITDAAGAMGVTSVLGSPISRSAMHAVRNRGEGSTLLNVALAEVTRREHTEGYDAMVNHANFPEVFADPQTQDPNY